MDIKELEDYRLSNAVKFHTQLNPRIWGADEHLLPEVREKLLAIAADFKEFLGLDLEVTDITISGSNAAYTYTDHSDIDLHLVTDLPRADASDVYRELFDAKKYQYNDQHNFKISGYDVELYVQNANQDPKSQGIYSVVDNEWISVPKRRKPDIDDISVKSKYEDLGQRIEAAIKSGNREQLELLGTKVREFRQAGLDKTGEFGPENLAFKVLRSNGTLDQLRAARLAARDQELSIAEAGKKKKKKSFRYGFGGYYFPGYHYYGQTDAATDGGGDGGESVKESADDLQTQLEKFAAFCVKKLGIENAPRIQLKRDPAWSQRNSTFGRYMPEANAMILSVANRHPMDIMRTLAHELVHRRQDEQEPMPGHAGNTGSDWENEANARAGVLMRSYGEQNPGMFDKKALAEDSFNQNFNQIDSIITKKYPKEIMNLLLGMFPTAKEAIINQYNDEDGMPFSEWRRAIWDIGNYVLSGPVVVNGSKLPIDPETEADRLAKYQQYIKDKDSGKPARYFRNNDSDPRTIDFTKLPPITIAQTDSGMSVTDGNHRAFLAKMAKKPLRAYVLRQQPNNHPNVAKIKALFSDQQVVSEASGYIPVTDAEARDPRYSMAITQDIRPGEVKRQAAKMGWKTTPAGTPPTARTNGLVEELTRKLQLVKEGVDFPLVSEEEELEEVAMSPSALRAFASSPAAADMQAGFEAELVFAGALEGSDESGEMEPDYDMDERASDIDSIMDFFSHGDMAGISSNTSSPSYQRARNQLEEDWFEWYSERLNEEFAEDQETLIENWIVENDWNQDQQIEEFLREELELSADEIREVDAAMERRMAGKGTAADADLVYKYNEAVAGVREQIELRVTDAIEEQNDDYESALEEFRSDYDAVDEQDWLSARGWRRMSDISNNFDFEWPYWTSGFGDNEEGGYNPDAARRLASSLSDTLGVKTTVSSGYHSAKRDTMTWIFEPDGSLDADDSDAMPVEIVSPPMPLSKTLEILPKFFEWAEENGAYANSSTGFHMSVSMGDHENNVLDFTKLALFLGDEYVLQQFGREANTYAKSALQKIREKKGNVKAEEILSTMRRHLGQFASRALAQPSGFGKYTSINPKNNYIEFRSAGGSNYFEDMDKIQNTLMRYARAMDIAMDPAADKPEYAKKLYKLLTDVKTQQTVDPKTGSKRTEVVPSADADAISIFSRYVAGELPKSELKGFLKKLQYGREVAKNPPKEKIQWRVTHPNGRATITLMASSADEAIKLAKQEYNDTMNPDDAYRAEPVVPAAQTPATDQLNAPAADDPAGNYVLRQREGNAGTGPVVYRFSAPNNMAAVAAAREWTTARGIERRSVWLDHISGVPPEVLNARPVRATLGEPRPAFTEPRSNSIPEVPLDIAQNFQEPPASWDSGSPIVSEPQNFPAARSTGGEFTGRWKVISSRTGEVLVILPGGTTSVQSDANQAAARWARQTRFDDPIEVYPEMR